MINIKPEYGIYVHSTKNTPYAELIVRGDKTIETRTRNVLRNLVGKRVLVIRTRSGRPTDVIGTVHIIKAWWYTPEALDDPLIREKTCVPPGSTFDHGGKGKWCYGLADPEEWERPMPLAEYKILARNMSFAKVVSQRSVDEELLYAGW